MFDAHTHLQDPRLEPFWTRLEASMLAAGVSHAASCGTSPADWPRLAALCEKPLSFTLIPAFGVHPWFVSELPENWEERLRAVLNQFPHAPVGEIGLDAIREGDAALQERVFLRQLAVAEELKRPVVLHGARRWGRLCDLLGARLGKLKGVLLHGASLSEEMLSHPVLRHPRVFFSLGGGLTHPGSERLHRMAATLALDRLMVETDSPDLFPAGGEPLALGFPGWPLNQPANLPVVVEALARIRKMDAAALARRTAQNAQAFFQ